jgi:DNA-binding LacI/PurR family transcriptional regulator
VVAVVMTNLLSPYFAELSDRLSDQLESNGYRAQFIISSDAARIERLFEDAVSRGIDGLISFSAEPSPKMLAIARGASVPVVLLNRSERVEGASLVWIDGPETGRSVAKMMLAEGRRRPVALATRPVRSRELDAFAETMEAAGSAACRWIDTGWHYADGMRAASDLLAKGERFDAVFAASDSLAIGFLEAARSLYGIDVPKDMSIVGFGDTLPSDWKSHQISTVSLPVPALIQTAVSTLMARIAFIAEPPPRIWLGCDLLERESSLGTTLAGER